jgi:hypothetical protein
MKTNISKCIWTACITAVALCITMTTAYASAPQDNIGTGYISSVVGVNGECAVDTTNGNTHKWDVQAGGTYTVTLVGATDCDRGMEGAIDVVVHNGCGINLNAVATQTPLGNTGVYTFQVTIPSGTQCGCTMPIEYCTMTSQGSSTPGFQTGTGVFAQGYDPNTGSGDTFEGHLRVNTFDNCSSPPTFCAGATPTPTPPCTGSITACKFYDFNASGTQDPTELLLAWPFCLTSDTDPNFQPVTKSSSDGSCVTFDNLPVGTYRVTEGTDALQPPAAGFFGSTTYQLVTITHCSQNVPVSFGNYCTVPSGGLTLGFWSNKNGQKILTGSYTATTLNPAAMAVLNSCSFRNADGSVHSFTTSYADLRKWLLGATATNMAYMLSAQLATLKLDVANGFVIEARHVHD